MNIQLEKDAWREIRVHDGEQSEQCVSPQEAGAAGVVEQVLPKAVSAGGEGGGKNHPHARWRRCLPSLSRSPGSPQLASWVIQTDSKRLFHTTQDSEDTLATSRCPCVSSSRLNTC